MLLFTPEFYKLQREDIAVEPATGREMSTFNRFRTRTRH